MRKQGDERDLADVGALAGHVRAGDERKRGGVGGGGEVGVVGNEVRRQRSIEHGVASAFDGNACFLHDFWTDPSLTPRDRGQARQRIEFGGAFTEGNDLVDVRGHLRQQRRPKFFFASDAIGLGAQNFFLELLELGRDVALGIAQRLLASEARGRLGGVDGGEFDVVAEHRVEADFERSDAARSDELGLVVRQPNA